MLCKHENKGVILPELRILKKPGLEVHSCFHGSWEADTRESMWVTGQPAWPTQGVPELSQNNSKVDNSFRLTSGLDMYTRTLTHSHMATYTH